VLKETKVLKTHTPQSMCCGGPAARAEQSSSVAARSFVVVGGGGQPSPHKIKESPGLKGCLANLQQLLLAELMEKRAAQASGDLRPDICRAARLPPTNQMPRFISDEKGGIFFRSCADQPSQESTRFNIFFGPASLTVMEKDELGFSRCSSE
jgi:hypothetical protein